MGKDLTWAVLPPDIAARLDELWACASSGACSHEPRCFVVHRELLSGYEFRYRQTEHRFVVPMLELGMGFEEGGLNIDDGQAFADPAGWPAYDAAAKARRPSGLSGIPVFKLRSNDGWLVTAREVEEALAHYDALSPSVRARYEAVESWRDWLDWLRVTRHHGGFTVE